MRSASSGTTSSAKVNSANTYSSKGGSAKSVRIGRLILLPLQIEHFRLLATNLLHRSEVDSYNRKPANVKNVFLRFESKLLWQYGFVLSLLPFLLVKAVWWTFALQSSDGMEIHWCPQARGVGNKTIARTAERKWRRSDRKKKFVDVDRRLRTLCQPLKKEHIRTLFEA